MNTDIEKLMYPIGRYQKQELNDLELRKEHLAILANLPRLVEHAIENIDEADFNIPYREGGWNLKQLIHHLADSHINAYIRIKLALTESNPTIKTYNEKSWAELSDNETIPVNVSITLLHALHHKIIKLLQNLNEDEWEKTYFHPEHKRNFPIWEVVGLYAWHSKHHLQHILEIKKSKTTD